MKRILTGLLILTLMLLALPSVALAQTLLQNDGWTSGSVAGFQGGFLSGEKWAAKFEANPDDYPITIQNIQFLFGGMSTATQTTKVRIYTNNPGGGTDLQGSQDVPGTQLFESADTFQITGADNMLSEIALSGEGWVISDGPFWVALDVTHDGFPGPARDDDGNIDRSANAIFDVNTGTWQPFSLYFDLDFSGSMGQPGDWVLRVNVMSSGPQAEVCDNALDDDNDGDTDCADTDCAGSAACGPENTAPRCSDGVDNDADGATDCADTDCTAAPNCVETNCTNGLDDDNDGDTDCFDSDCSTNAACLAETLCGDGVDNDADGATDCADTDCTTDINCVPLEICDDGIDNDLDGDTDCADSNCMNAANCMAADMGMDMGPDMVDPIADLSITSMLPNMAEEGASTLVQIRGGGFSNDTIFRLGVTELQGIVIANDTLANATVPETLTAGTYDLIAQDNVTGNLSMLPSAFEVTSEPVDVPEPPPAISSVTPLRGIPGDPITIFGMNFQDGATISLDTIDVAFVQFEGATELTFVIPSGLEAGSYSVKVTNPDGQSDQATTNLVVPAEEVATGDEGGCGCTTTRGASPMNKTGLLLSALFGFFFFRRRRS